MLICIYIKNGGKLMNKNTKSFLEDYINQDKIDYGVMLKGGWGCGKTHFIEDFISHIENKKLISKANILKISLYGVNTIEELEKEILKQIYKIINSNSYIYAKSFIKIAVSKFDDVLTALENCQTIGNMKNKLIIIDDMERSGLNPIQVLGYISDYIVNDNVKAIFICNEDEIKDEYKIEYFKMKEKSIAYTLEISPSKEDAIKHFIEDLELDSTFITVAVDICNNLEFNNLRLIKNAITNYQYILKKFPENKLCETEYLKKIFEINLVLFLQKDIKLDEKMVSTLKKYDNSFDYNYELISLILHSYYSFNSTLDKSIDRYEQDLYSLQRAMYFEGMKLKNCWSDIILNGIFDSDKIQEAITYDFPMDCPKNLYYLLNNFSELNSKEFEMQFEKLNMDISNGKYLNIGDLMIFYSYFLMFSEKRIIPYTQDAVLAHFECFIKDKSENIKGDICITNSYNGLGFTDNCHFHSIKQKLQDISRENNIKNKQLQFNEQIRDSVVDLKDIANKLFDKNSDNYDYNEITVINDTNIDDLFLKLKEAPLNTQKQFFVVLEYRYYGNTFKKYSEEIKVVEKLKSLYETTIESLENQYNPIILGYEEIVRQCNLIIDKNES